MDGTADADYNEWRIQKQEWIDMGSKENKVNDLRIRRAVPADLEGVTMVKRRLSLQRRQPPGILSGGVSNILETAFSWRNYRMNREFTVLSG